VLPFVTGATGAVDQGLTVATTDVGICPSNTATKSPHNKRTFNDNEELRRQYLSLTTTPLLSTQSTQYINQVFTLPLNINVY